jgi:hypothetical protein
MRVAVKPLVKLYYPHSRTHAPESKTDHAIPLVGESLGAFEASERRKRRPRAPWACISERSRMVSILQAEGSHGARPREEDSCKRRDQGDTGYKDALPSLGSLIFHPPHHKASPHNIHITNPANTTLPARTRNRSNMDFNHIGHCQGCGYSCATPSVHMDELEKQDLPRNPQFSLCCLESVTNADLFFSTPRRLHATSLYSTLSVTRLLHPFLNSNETRMHIFRPLFKQIVLYALIEVAVLLHNTSELCHWCTEIDNSSGSIHFALSDMLSTEIPTHAWQNGTAKFGKIETLMLLVQELSERLEVPTHCTVEDLIHDQAAINACRCIAETLESMPHHDSERVLGPCKVAEDLFCKVVSRDHLRSAPSWTRGVSVVGKSYSAGETGTQSLVAGKMCEEAAQLVQIQAPDTCDDLEKRGTVCQSSERQ